MAETNMKIQNIRCCFGDKIFSTNDLFNFYRIEEPDIERSLVNWRVYDFVKKGMLKRMGKGLFKIDDSETYTPIIDDKTKKIFNEIAKNFPFLSCCCWNTSMLNAFTQHLVNKQMTLVEVDRDGVESVANFLKVKHKNIFFNPSKEVIDNYLHDLNEAIVVRNLVTESPLLKVGTLNTASLEKILVDMFCDTAIFSFYQGNELTHIYKNVMNEFTVNMPKMMRYAKRRGKHDEIKDFIAKNNI